MSRKPTYEKLLQNNSDLERQNNELKKFKAGFQYASDGMALLNLKGKFLEVNEKFCDTVGYTRKKLLQLKDTDFRPPETQAEFEKKLNFLKKREALSWESIYFHKNGNVLSLELQASMVQILGDGPVIQVVARDITRRKQREDLLCRYEHIFSLTEDLIAFIDKNYIYKLINENYSKAHNKKWDKIVGYSVAELFGDKIFQQTIKPQFDRCLSGETVHYQTWVEFSPSERRYRDATYYPYRLSDGSLDGVVAIIRDLTDTKLAEEKEQLERERLTHVLQAIPDGVYIVDQQHNIEYVNPVIEKTFGPVKRKKCFQYLHNRTKPCVDCTSKKVFAGESLQRNWHSINNKKHYEVFDSPLKSIHGHIEKVTFFHDVTEQRKVAKVLQKNRIDLQENNKRLTALINASPDIICFKDGKGRWLLANETMLRLFQLTGVDYKGKSNAKLAQYNEFYHDTLLTCMETDETAWENGVLSYGKEIIPTPEGEDKIFDIVKVPLFLADGTRQGLVVQGHDITEHLKIEKNLRQEVVARQQAAEVVKEKSKETEEANIALRVLLNQQKNVAEEVQQRVLVQLEKAVFPYINLLRQYLLDKNGQEYLNILTSNLHEVGTSFIKKLSNPDLGLTKREILVADLVRQGKNTKEIAKLLKLKPPSVETYRNKIRKKLRITNNKITLHQYLNVTFTSKK